MIVSVKETNKQKKTSISISHINRCTMISNKSRANPTFLSWNKCTHHLQSDELGSETNTVCLPFHFLFYFWEVSLFMHSLNFISIDVFSMAPFSCQVQVKG